MTKEKSKLFFLFLIGGIVGILGMYLYQNFNKDDRNTNSKIAKTKSTTAAIDQLTDSKVVIIYFKANRKLPDYYITKREAKAQGWIPSKGNLCEILPGRAIGGDNFSNREKRLPQGKYFEADVNYSCGGRNADRIIFNNDGDVWLKKDHYKTFQKQ